MNARAAIASRQGGFTLIEAMVAMLVASVVLLALAAMLIMAIRTNQMSEHRMDATVMAQSILDHVTAKCRNTLNYTQAQAQIDAQGIMPSGSIYTPTVSMNPTTVVPGTVHITVKLSWQEHGNNKNVMLVSQVWVQ